MSSIHFYFGFLEFVYLCVQSPYMEIGLYVFMPISAVFQ